MRAGLFVPFGSHQLTNSLRGAKRALSDVSSLPDLRSKLDDEAGQAEQTGANPILEGDTFRGVLREPVSAAF